MTLWMTVSPAMTKKYCFNVHALICFYVCPYVAVVLKLFGSWTTFVFQKPFAGHKN